MMTDSCEVISDEVLCLCSVLPSLILSTLTAVVKAGKNLMRNLISWSPGQKHWPLVSDALKIHSNYSTLWRGFACNGMFTPLEWVLSGLAGDSVRNVAGLSVFIWFR